MPQEVFERHADAYDDWFVLHRKVYRAECERIREILPAPDAHLNRPGGLRCHWESRLGLNRPLPLAG